MIADCRVREAVRIADVRAIPTSFPIPPASRVTLGIGTAVKKDTVLVKVTTGDGLTGWGEAHHGRAPGAVAHLVNTTLRQLVLGLDALDVVGVWARVYRMQLGSHGMGAAASIALSGLDMALWDLRGKAAGWPLYRLLGGGARSIPAYAGGVSLGWQDPDAARRGGPRAGRGGVPRGQAAGRRHAGPRPGARRRGPPGPRRRRGDPGGRQHRLHAGGRPAGHAGPGRAGRRVAGGAVPGPRPPELRDGGDLRPPPAGGGREPLHAVRVHPRHRGPRAGHPPARPLQVRRRDRGRSGSPRWPRPGSSRSIPTRR